MRFQVSQVMDAIEQRLSTDVTGAQAVVDLGAVVRLVDLDGGRPVNLVRIGMVVDALGRYLLDGGALLYGVVERALLSEGAFTSKERMVLSRWADDGLIEATAEVGDRATEIAELTGLPLIVPGPEPEQAKRYARLSEGAGCVLRLIPRAGAAVLIPMVGVADAEVDLTAGGTPAGQAIGRAKVPTQEDTAPAGDAGSGKAEPEAPPAAEVAQVTTAEADEEAEAAQDGGAQDQDGEAEDAGTPDAGTEDAGTEDAGTPDPEPDPEPDPDPDPEPRPAAPAAGTLPLPVEVFSDHGPTRTGPVRVSRRRNLRAEPASAYASMAARQWRCDGFECPAFGEHRRIGQPVPRMRGEVPVCPRHGEPVTDAGPRPPSYPVSIVVDDLPRQRLVVRDGAPVQVGRDDDPEVISVARWLHKAASQWVSPVHLKLEAGDGGLVVTDLSVNGTVVWQRTGPDDPGTTRQLRRESYQLGEWDSVELYTGIELVRGDRRPAAALGRDGPASVLVDAPTAVHRQVNA